MAIEDAKKEFSLVDKVKKVENWEDNFIIPNELCLIQPTTSDNIAENNNYTGESINSETNLVEKKF